ncbi:MAG: hypothetical protein AAGF47_06600 [Planctomycetota bacterium]
MSPSAPRTTASSKPKKPMSGLSFAFPMQMPRGGTGAGVDHRPRRSAMPAMPGKPETRTR